MRPRRSEYPDAPGPAVWLFHGYRNRLLFLLRLRRFRQGDSQNAALVVSFDLLGVDAAGKLQRTAERTIATLGDVAVLGLLFLLFLLFALDRQDAVGKLKVDVLGIQARQFGGDLESLFLLDDIDGRRDVEAKVTAPERLYVG